MPCERFTQIWRSRGTAFGLCCCECCGERLMPPGTREYRLVTLATDAASFSVHLDRRIRHRKPSFGDEGFVLRARSLAHDARALYPHLRFEFDTDADGRPLN